MRAARYYAAFSPQRIGTISIAVSNDGDGESYDVFLDGSTVTLGNIYRSMFHGKLGDYVIGTDTFPFQRAAFGDLLQELLRDKATAAGSAVTWTVAWSNATLLYTITSAGGAGVPAMTLSEAAQHVLGMPSAPTPATGVFTSTHRPRYVMPTAVGMTSMNTGDQHRPNQVRSAITDAGNQFGIGPTRRAIQHRWQQRHEPQSAVFAWDSGGLWTYQDLFEHCGAWEPLLVIPDATTAAPLFADAVMRFSLLGDDANCMPTPTFSEFDGRWDVPFSAVVTHRKQSA
jgi:hypothetical protein